MAEVVIVEAVRTPVGRRNGGLSSMHSIDLLAAVQAEVLAARVWIRARSARSSAGAWARSGCRR